jgi:hypothetical protein
MVPTFAPGRCSSYRQKRELAAIEYTNATSFCASEIKMERTHEVDDETWHAHLILLSAPMSSLSSFRRSAPASLHTAAMLNAAQ